MNIPCQCLLGQLLPADLHRFQHYSRLILDLRVEKYRPGVDSYVILSLSKALAGRPLLPRLQKLLWSQSRLSDHDILHLISPSLHHLIFSYDGFASSIVPADSGTECMFLLDTLLQQVAVAAPSLRRLCLASPDTTIPCAFVPFSVCRSLRQVDISARTLVGRCTYLSALTSLQNLTTLALSGLRTLEDDDVKALRGFSTLEHIFLEGDCASLGCVLLHVGRSPSTIQKVDISVFGYNTEKLAALSVIVSQFSASLEELCLDTLIDEEIRLNISNPLPMAVIQPLLSMGQLRTVYWSGAFVPPSSAGWSTEDFCAMASAWPKLISLVILWESWPQTVPSPTATLECLPHIARVCPCLRVLRITTMKWTWAADLDAYPIMSHGLKTLDIVTDITEDTSAVQRTVADAAFFLDRLFPYLDTRKDELATQMSKDVFKHIRTLQAARLQERRRITSEKR